MARKANAAARWNPSGSRAAPICLMITPSFAASLPRQKTGPPVWFTIFATRPGSHIKIIGRAGVFLRHISGLKYLRSGRKISGVAFQRRYGLYALVAAAIIHHGDFEPRFGQLQRPQHLGQIHIRGDEIDIVHAFFLQLSEISAASLSKVISLP